MKRKFILLISLLLSIVSHSQYIVVQDTTSALNNELIVDYKINGNLSELDSIEIIFSSISLTDTLTLFSGVYISDEDDPSSFELFDFDESINEINLRIGSFESAVFYTRIRIRKLNGTLEEFIL